MKTQDLNELPTGIILYTVFSDNSRRYYMLIDEYVDGIRIAYTFSCNNKLTKTRTFQDMRLCRNDATIMMAKNKFEAALRELQ